jgi:hypothetical protein
MTPRVRNILQSRWESAGKPVEGWVWCGKVVQEKLQSFNSVVYKRFLHTKTCLGLRPDAPLQVDDSDPASGRIACPSGDPQNLVAAVDQVLNGFLQKFLWFDQSILRIREKSRRCSGSSYRDSRQRR